MLLFYLSLLDDEESKLTFESIYTLHKDVALRLAYRITNDLSAAEDAVHNGFLQIIKDWDKFLQIPCDKRRSRIVIIVKNKAIDFMRKERRMMDSELEENDILDPSAKDDIIAILEHKDDLEYIISCVSKLPEIYKMVLELKYFHDLSEKEISAVLGLKQSTVAMRLIRAKSKLKKIMENNSRETI